MKKKKKHTLADDINERLGINKPKSESQTKTSPLNVKIGELPIDFTKILNNGQIN